MKRVSSITVALVAASLLLAPAAHAQSESSEGSLPGGSVPATSSGQGSLNGSSLSSDGGSSKSLNGLSAASDEGPLAPALTSIEQIVLGTLTAGSVIPGSLGLGSLTGGSLMASMLLWRK